MLPAKVYYVDMHTHTSNAKQEEVYALKSWRINELKTSLLQGQEKLNSPHTLGLHPYFDEDLREEELQSLADYLGTKPKHLWGIGECGLDKRSSVPLVKQIEFFKSQIILSEQYQKPLVLHIVKAWDELLAIKKELKPKQKWIIHGFRGKVTLAEQLLKADLYLSFGLYFQEDSFRLAHQRGKAFLETDEQSQPSIIEQYETIAKLLGISSLQLQKELWQRFLELQSIF